MTPIKNLPADFPTFGEKISGQRYEIRPGVYAIIFDDTFAVALVKVGQSYFLPGGGAEHGESPAETIRREIHEECGYDVALGGYVGTAVDYLFARNENKHYEIQSVFWEAKRGHRVSEPQEVDHQLIWREVGEAQKLLARPSQAWALAKAWAKYADITMSDTVYTTERLIARRWRDSDLAPLFTVYSDADAMRWVDDGQPITLDECKHWFEVTRANYEKRGYGMFALEEKASGEVIGFGGIVHPGGQAEPEVKYAFLCSHWGQGLATEAVTGLIEYGARVHGLSYMIATVAPANIASQRVLQKSGMEQGELVDNDDGTQTQLFHWYMTPRAT